jgi:hypothetical protein
MTLRPPLDSAISRLASVLAEAYDSETEWPQQVRACISAVLDFFVDEPELARLCTVESFVASPAITRRYQEGLAVLVPYLRLGRELREDGDLFPETTERGLLGSMNSLIARKVSAGEATELPQLLPDLVQFALTPYLGAAEARRVALPSAA